MKTWTKAFECHLKIVGVPDINYEMCTNTLQQIMTKLGSHGTIQNIFRISSKFSDKPRKISVFDSVYEKKKIWNKQNNEN